MTYAHSLGAVVLLSALHQNGNISQFIRNYEDEADIATYLLSILQVEGAGVDGVD